MDENTDKDENPVSGVGVAMLSFFAACSLIIGGLATWGLCAFVHYHLFPVNADFVGVTAAGIVGLLFVCTPTRSCSNGFRPASSRGPECPSGHIQKHAPCRCAFLFLQILLQVFSGV